MTHPPGARPAGEAPVRRQCSGAPGRPPASVGASTPRYAHTRDRSGRVRPKPRQHACPETDRLLLPVLRRPGRLGSRRPRRRRQRQEMAAHPSPRAVLAQEIHARGELSDSALDLSPTPTDPLAEVVGSIPRVQRGRVHSPLSGGLAPRWMPGVSRIPSALPGSRLGSWVAHAGRGCIAWRRGVESAPGELDRLADDADAPRAVR